MRPSIIVPGSLCAGGFRSKTVLGLGFCEIQGFAFDKRRDGGEAMFASARRLCPRLEKLSGAGDQVESASRALYRILEQHGPITATECWSHASQMENHALKSKQHLKMMLRWMRERKTVNVVCQHKGDKKSSSPSDRKFLFSISPRKAHERNGTASPAV